MTSSLAAAAAFAYEKSPRSLPADRATLHPKEGKIYTEEEKTSFVHSTPLGFSAAKITRRMD